MATIVTVLFFLLGIVQLCIGYRINQLYRKDISRNQTCAVKKIKQLFVNAQTVKCQLCMKKIENTDKIETFLKKEDFYAHY